MNKYQMALKLAKEMGYRYEDGKVFSFTGKCINIMRDGNERDYFSIRPSVKKVGKRMMMKVPLHRFLVYLEIGDAIFADGFEVRHLDDNKQNNNPDNLLIGTRVQNWYDRPEEKRRAICIAGALSKRKYSDAFVGEVREMRGLGMSYRKLAKNFGLTKSVARHLCKHTFKTLGLK